MAVRSPARKRPIRRTKRADAGSTEMARCVLVVRRGSVRRYRELRRQTKGAPFIVMWDPRSADRRAAPATRREQDRRRAERRQAAPFPWELADFLVMFRPVPKKPRARR